MKKLLALLLTFLLIFTACSGEEKPIYETFKFDEKVIRKETTVDIGENNNRMVEAYDSSGRTVRSIYKNKLSGEVIRTSEYIYSNDGSYIIRSYGYYNSDRSKWQEAFAYCDKDGNLIKSYTYLRNPSEKDYHLHMSTVNTPNETGIFSVRTEYDDAGNERVLQTIQYDNDGRDLLTTFENYESGFAEEFSRDYENHITNRTIFRDGVIQERTVKYAAADSLPLREEYYGVGDVLEEYTIYLYSEETGLRERQTTYFADGSIKVENTYDREGRLLTFVEMDKDGNVIQDEVITMPEN